jgi:rod shape-determining protein MreC
MESSRDDFVIAIRSAFLNKGTQQRFSLLGLILFSIIILYLGSLNFKAISYLKIGIKEVVYRASFIVSGPENFLKRSIILVNDHFDHYSDYKNTKNRLKELQTKDLSKEIITLENIKLKKLIDDYFITDNEIYAKVLIDKQSPFLRSVVLNKGSKDSIKLGMAVLDGIYLVGKVIEVNFLTSRVLLLSDLNAKIPVTLEPGNLQAIMSGTGKEQGILQYTKDNFLDEINESLLVFTSGSGGLFKSGIPVGEIKKENILINEDKKIDFYVDFSQLKYVRVLSFAKEKFLEKPVNDEIKQIDTEITEIKKKEETLKVLLEQKKIAEEIRIKIEEENKLLKDKVINLRNEISVIKKIIEEVELKKEDIKFLELNLLYGSKCKKTFYNKLYKVGTNKYRECVLNKGKVKKN